MIADKIFKSLTHSCGNYETHLHGQTLDEGYRPDYVLKKESDFIILESENSSSRKTFVGGMMKAAHFLQGERTGRLIFIIVRKKNTKPETIALHLRKYLHWIQRLSNLKEVYVIETSDYCSNEMVIKIDSKEFSQKAHKV